MAITDMSIIDNISVGVDNRCYLTISDHLDWKVKGEHLKYLQDKLNAYVGFVQSGQLIQDYQELDLVIQVIAKHQIPNEIYGTAKNQISNSLKEDGFDFEWSKLSQYLVD